jgi:DNA-binding transcriptional LysR family regulator
MEQNSLMALKVMLQQGVGLSILPYTVVHEETRDGRLGIRCIRRPRMVRHVAIVRPEYRPAFHALSIVERILAEELRRMPVSPHRAAASADEAAR